MPFDGTLKFDTAIDQTGFKVGLDKLGGIAKMGMAAVTGAITAATGAVSALGTAAVTVGSGFESSMAQVIATMGITKDTVKDGVNSFDLLSQAAQDAGANTTFSASEAADALNYLALAGYDAVKATDALPAVLDLAAAGGLDLAYASDLATDAMAALGIEASSDNLTAFGDQMAKTASKANTSVAQLGEAILTVGGTAKSLVGGTTELNAALGVLANRGIKGAEGGTHLRNMILSLSAPTDTAKAALDALGVSALDAKGNMRPLNETFADLNNAMDGMSDGDKSAILSDIFNKTDLAAAQALMAGCGDEFTELTEALDNCDGAMSQMAKTMNDTLEGDMKSLQSKAEALGIAVYQDLGDPLRELAQLGGRYISELTDAFTNGGFTGAAEAIGGILSDAVTKLTGYLPDIIDLGTKIISSLAEGLTANSGKIIRTGIDIAMTLLSGFGEVSVDLLELGAGLLTSLAEGVEKRLPRIQRITKQVMQSLSRSLAENLPVMLEAGVDIIETLGGVILENLPLLLDCAITIIRSLAAMLSDPAMLTGLLDAGLSILEMLMQVIGDNLGMLIEAAIVIVETIGVYLAEHAPELVTAALELVTAIVTAILENTDGMMDASLSIIMAFADALTDPERMKPLLDAAGTLIQQLFEGLGNYGENLGYFVYDLSHGLGDKLAAVDWAALGKSILDGIFSGLLGVDFDFYDYLDTFKENWVSGIKDLFGIHSPSRLMRDEVGKYLALGIGEGFTEEMPDVGRDALGAFDRMRREVDPGAVQALSDSASAFSSLSYVTPPASSQIINNYSSNSYTTHQTSGAAPDAPTPGGDIIIPVNIGGEQLDTIVIKAAQIANARSGGVTI